MTSPQKQKINLLLGGTGLFLLLLATWQIHQASAGLRVVASRAGDLPVEIASPNVDQAEKRPLVLIGHGFSGSRIIMRGFAYTLAHAGYNVVSWDFDGHATNPRPLPADPFSGDLIENASQARSEVERLGLADTTRVAIIGHSMGSGVALGYGQRIPQTMATIAVSPVSTTVTPELPHNLLLLAGSNEPNFIRNAEQRLAEAGGTGGETAAGTARKLTIIPGVEHISILFSPTAHKAARDWLDATFGSQPGTVEYTDQRVLWYALGVCGTLLAAISLIPATERPSDSFSPSRGRRLLALASGGLGATLLLALMNRLGINLNNAMGMMVGGYLLAWFATAGLITLIILNLGGHWSWLKLPPRNIAWDGILVTAALWVGIGLLGGQVWLPWLLIPSRLVWWPLAILCTLPWFLGVGYIASPALPWGRAAWWLVSAVVLAGSLLLTLVITPGVFFLLLILPVFPLVLASHAIAAGRQRHAWAFGISGALFTSWLLLAVFPLS